MLFINYLQNSNSIKKSSRGKPLLLFLFLISYLPFSASLAQTNQINLRFTDAIINNTIQNYPPEYYKASTFNNFHFTIALSYKHYTPTFYFTELSLISSFQNDGSKQTTEYPSQSTTENVFSKYYQNKIGLSVGYGKRLFFFHFLCIESSLQANLFPYYETIDRFSVQQISTTQNRTNNVTKQDKYYNNEFSFSLILHPSVYITKKVAIGVYLDNQFSFLYSKKNVMGYHTLYNTATNELLLQEEVKVGTAYQNSFANNWLIPYFTISYNLK